MADDDPPRPGPAPDGGPEWPHRPAEPEGAPFGGWPERAPQAEAAPPSGPAAPDQVLRRPSPQPGPAPAPPAPQRRRLAVVAAVVAVLLVGATIVGVLASRGSDDEKAGGPAGQTTVARGSGRSGRTAPPGTSPSGQGTELTLLAGRVVVAARPGWEQLDNSDDTGSVRLVLSGPNGREILGTLSIASLSSPDSFDTTLKLDGGTSFEVQGGDGPFRVTAQPSPGGRMVAGAARPRGAFFLNVSVVALDGKGFDVPTLRALFTDQVAPALSFP